MRICATVKPNSKKGPLVEIQPDGSLNIYIREIAAYGKANAGVIKLLAKHYNVPKTNIIILKGSTSRHKIINIMGI
ncbi:hypothetical protein CVV43_01535 [Candidatus Saccharibacteria bacterium HGW-Saccharibacteria-1]|jgi:hypothetical protein|nr:MAG: hypothetical protein CVV43_01535 [Candidatus Saccharibacteria bacterium HGW-Saccharibacteria-1]